MHSRGFVAANCRSAEEGRLRSADGSVAVIVQDEEFDGQVMLHDSRQLLNVELEPSVTVNADSATMSPRNRCSNAGWDCKTHTPQRSRVKNLSVLFRFVG